MSQGGISVDRVKAIDVFSELDDDELEEVAAAAHERTYEQDDELIHREQWPEDLLALEEGEVQVCRDGEIVAELGAGCVVGERGTLRRALRNADVVATSPVKALYFPLNTVRQLRRDVPELGDRLQALADERG